VCGTITHQCLHSNEETDDDDDDDDDDDAAYDLDADMTAMLLEMSVSRMCHFGVELHVAQVSVPMRVCVRSRFVNRNWLHMCVR
jgi:hypothetical protein